MFKNILSKLTGAPTNDHEKLAVDNIGKILHKQVSDADATGGTLVNQQLLGFHTAGYILGFIEMGFVQHGYTNIESKSLAIKNIGYICNPIVFSGDYGTYGKLWSLVRGRLQDTERNDGSGRYYPGGEEWLNNDSYHKLMRENSNRVYDGMVTGMDDALLLAKDDVYLGRMISGSYVEVRGLYNHLISQNFD